MIYDVIIVMWYDDTVVILYDEMVVMWYNVLLVIKYDYIIDTMLWRTC